MSANFDGTNAESQPNKNTKDINNSKNKKDTSNKEQIPEKNKQNKGRTSHGLTVLLRTIKNHQAKQKIQNGPLRSATRERTYRDHLWKFYTFVTQLKLPQTKRYGPFWD